jgi:hypothetical protein
VWTTWRSENSYHHRDLKSDPSVVQPVASRYTDYAIPAQAIIEQSVALPTQTSRQHSLSLSVNVTAFTLGSDLLQRRRSCVYIFLTFIAEF